MKRTIYKILLSITFILIIFFLLTFELQTISNKNIIIFWHNLKFIASTLYTLIPLIILVVFFLLLFTNRWALRVEKLSIGGFSIIFDNPAHMYKRQIKNLLDTKRTIFKIDCEHDNFSETLDSYFQIYKFFRDEINILGNIKKKWFRNEETISLYNLTNQAIVVLNNFLTENQNNYRRWYKYIEKTREEDYYLKPIGELQKEYPGYDNLCNGFTKINKFFVEKFANEFEVDTLKWEIKKSSDK